jgi:uncharacterized membrane protein
MRGIIIALGIESVAFFISLIILVFILVGLSGCYQNPYYSNIRCDQKIHD